MPGAIYQLHVKGPQDEFLTATPQVNFIHKIYKQYTNFAIEPIRLDFDDEVNFSRTSKVVIKNKADLLSNLYFKFNLPVLTKTSGTYAGWTNSIGHAIIDYVDIEIGDKLIDRHYGLFMHIWDELTGKDTHGSDQLIGKYQHLTLLEENAKVETSYYVPLMFWFCKGLGHAFPLISLQSHQIKLIFHFRPFEECIVYDGTTPPSTVSIHHPEIIADYVFLEDDQRKKLMYTEHRILIEQIQYRDGYQPGHGGTNGIFNASLNLNHPCKELIWVLIEQDSEVNNDWFNFSKRNAITFTKLESLMDRARLIIDGQDRTIMHDYKVYSLVNTHRYHTNTVDKHIFCLPLCDKPEQWQPSGSLNFSATDDAILQVSLNGNTSSSVKLYVFAINYNLLYIKNGMAAIAFST